MSTVAPSGARCGAPSGVPDEALRAAAALCYVADLSAPELDEGDRHHLRDVLRLSSGERVALCDGSGRYRLATVTGAEHHGRARRPGTGRFELAPDAAVVSVPPPPYRLTVAFGLQKGERAEWTVQKLTELGIDRIVPLLTERTIVRLDGPDRARRRVRLERVAREAAAQARRCRLPEVAEPVGLEALSDEAGLVLAEPGGRLLDGSERTVVVGPEGGFSARELGRFAGRIGLGETVLRAETAAIASGTLLAAQRRVVVEAEVARSKHPGK